LKKQIEIIDPKHFILLGEVTFSVFLPKEKIKKPLIFLQGWGF